MKKIIDTEELKQIQLSILNSIADFCDSRGIRYYLAYGTLIGAVRHEGFIPWDDDIDLIMPRPDYERFCKEYNGNYSNYQVQYSGNNEKWIINFAKVQDIRTRFQEEYSIEMGYGVFVDIFPLDGYINKFQMWLCHYLYKMIHYKSLATSSTNSILKNVGIFFMQISLSLFSMRGLLNCLEFVSKMKGFDESNKVFYFSEKKKPFERYWFCDYKLGVFEGRQYKMPIGTHEYLTFQYGNYMQLPPENERVNKHQAKAWWKYINAQ